MITLAHLHKDAIKLLSDVSDTARLDAELLISHVLDIPRTRFITEPDALIETAKLATIQKFLQQRQQGYPVAYLLGRKHFWDLELTVTPDTLIPRPETELLVESALLLFSEHQSIEVADLGTGSGAIAIAIARARPHWHVLATDRYPPTLQIAEQNAARYKLQNIEFLHSDWFEKLNPEKKFDILISNPPYIRENDPHLKQGDVQFEPLHALHAGEDGLRDIRHLIASAARYLNPNGWLLLEHGYDQSQAVHALLLEAGYQAIQHKHDLAGHIRMSMGQKADG